MKKRHIILLLIVLVSFFTACTLLRPQENIESIDFGGQGGFIDQKTLFTLYQDGKIYKEDTLIMQLDSEQVDSLFLQAAALQNPIEHPGSFSYFLTVNTPHSHKTWVWTPNYKGDSTIDTLNSLYHKLLEIVKH